MRVSGKEEKVLGLLGMYNKLGIPHFQRGLIWNIDTKSDLLESLYENTPCGSIVLWKTNNKKKGINMGNKPFEYLIVDGQQRIDCLNEVMNEFEQENHKKHNSAVWCLNLSRVKELEGKIKSINKQYSLFIKAKKPEEATGRLKYNLIPLKYLLQENDELLDLYKKGRIFILRDKEAAKGEQYIMELIREKVCPKIRDIRERNFYVTYLSDCNLSEVVQVFNRINSGGSRIQSEERAFATLVSMYEETDECIQKLFNDVHKDKKALYDIRNVVLKREKERNFGFKLFIRIFILVCNYHFGYSIGSSSLSFSVVWSNRFHDKIEKNKEGIRKLWQIANKIICYVNDILKDNLHCDDYRFLPETNSLLPIFQLLIRYPKLHEDIDIEKKYRPHLLWLCLAYFLVWYDSKEILGFVSQIKNSNETAWECIKSLKKDIKEQLKLGDLEKWLNLYPTQQNRYLLLLYWLLRFNGINDFSYEENDVNKIIKGKEKLIDANAIPQKQHIIPYSHLRKIYPELEESTRRFSTHEAHNIGNMTYISESLNRADALGDNFTNLKKEPVENLRRHYLNSENLLKQYYAIQKKSGLSNSFKRNFLNFCRIRRKLIAKGFIDWLGKFRTNSIDEKARNEKYRVEPGQQMFLEEYAMPIADRIRTLNYDNRIEDLLIEITENGKLKYLGKKQSLDRFRIELAKKTSRKKKRNIATIAFEAKRIHISFHDNYYIRKISKVLTLKNDMIKLSIDESNLENNLNILKLIHKHMKI